MKYQVLYRLQRAGYAPGMSMQPIEARNHRELNDALAGIRQKWERHGYQVRILAVNKGAETRTRQAK